MVRWVPEGCWVAGGTWVGVCVQMWHLERWGDRGVWVQGGWASEWGWQGQADCNLQLPLLQLSLAFPSSFFPVYLPPLSW